MNNLKQHSWTIGILLLTAVLGVTVFLTVMKLNTTEPVAPTAPQSKPQAATAACTVEFKITVNTPTPTVTPPAQCNGECTTNAQCPSEMVCSSGRCRNPQCTGEDDCSCPGTTVTPTVTPTATPVLQCNGDCSSNAQCPASMVCSSGKCRNAQCTGETDCNCPGPTVTPSNTPTPTTPIVQGPTNTPGPRPEVPEAGTFLPTAIIVVGGLAILAIGLLL